MHIALPHAYGQRLLIGLAQILHCGSVGVIIVYTGMYALTCWIGEQL